MIDFQNQSDQAIEPRLERPLDQSDIAHEHEFLDTLQVPQEMHDFGSEIEQVVPITRSFQHDGQGLEMGEAFDAEGVAAPGVKFAKVSSVGDERDGSDGGELFGVEDGDFLGNVVEEVGDDEGCSV